MRVLGVDFGRRRIGLAISDTSALLARPWKTVPAASTPAASAVEVAAAVAAERNADGDERIGAVVVGLPKRLNGDESDETRAARLFAEGLGRALALDVHLQDERLTSREAESRLAVRERDWRRRKALLDATSAAIILQDFLDARAPVTPATMDDAP